MNILEIDYRKEVNTKFLCEFSVLTGMVGVRKQENNIIRTRFPEVIDRDVSEKAVIIKGDFKPFYNINKNKVEEIARVYQEERKGVEIEERIVHAENYFEKRIEKDKWKYNKHSASEKEATKNAFKLIKKGFDVMFWISPESDIYEEGRLNVMISGVTDGEFFFDPWGIPLLLNENESIGLANKLLDKGGVLAGEPKILREQTIGFKLENGKKWIEKCEELMPEMKWAWKTIREGKVDQNMKKLALKIKKATEMSKGDNFAFERIMSDMGYKLNVSGNHGGAWLSQERGVIIVVTPDGIKYKVGRTEGLVYCEKCGCWHSGEKCPVCG